MPRTRYELSANFQPASNNLQFQNIVVDECHCVRHTDSTSHEFLMLLPRTPNARLLLVSATPTLNDAGDLHGLARAVALYAQLPVSLPSSVKALQPYLAKDFKPFDEELNAKDEEAPAPIFTNTVLADEVAALKSWYLADPETRKFWLLAPSAYKRLNYRNPMVQRPIFDGTLRLLQTRRTAKTSLQLPPDADNVETTYPGSVMPPTGMKAVEASHKASAGNASTASVFRSRGFQHLTAAIRT